MCGFTGLLDPSATQDSLSACATAMAAAIIHRGPDDGGVWLDPSVGLALAHRRLSILDLSPLGHQPMASASGRFVIAYNGEVYNFGDLRTELTAHGVAFRGHSDTEVLLAAIEAWGIEQTCRRANGMFAFALWDRESRTLTLGRDRFGQKPLYYGTVGGRFLFGSELKALTAHPGFDGRLDHDSLTLFLRHGYVPAPRSIWRGIAKLTPGCLLQVGADGSFTAPHPYWSALDAARLGLSTPFDGDAADAADALETLLDDAVGKCMVADVPLGAFLSGGVDSSAVVALMQKRSARPVRTFSIGFADAAYDESKHAAAVARHLGTDHTELTVTEAEALDVIPSLPAMYDEPFADSSQVPTYLLSKLTRAHVTVSLSGDGGDEVFGGYNRYLWGRQLGRLIHTVPGGVRRLGCAALTALPVAGWDGLAAAARPLLPGRLRVAHPGDKLHKLAGVAGAADAETAYLGLTSLWHDPALLTGTPEPASAVVGAARSLAGDLVERMMMADTVTYLPDDILVKVDRASMAVSLESRIPLLDHRIYEFAWSLPLGLKLAGGQGKRPLRDVLYRHVPRPLIERPKMGFGVPIGDWLRGQLRDWAENLLSEDRLSRQGLLEPRLIRRAWAEHQSGRRNWQHQLWAVLMLQAWLDATPGAVP